MRAPRRRGFTIAEVLISLVIAGVIGMAATKLLMSQNRYYDHETNLRTARSIARSARNVLLADLRMVQDLGGVDSVASDGKLIRILVPYRVGLVCGTNSNTTTVSMLPIDSGTIAVSVYRGFAWRDSVSGLYTYVWPSSPTSGDIPVAAADPSICTGSGAGQAQIRTVSVNGRAGNILDLKSQAASGAPAGAPVFFWQRISYSFHTSNAYPNRLGLWRNVEGGLNEEIMAPFDTSARFRFYASGSDTPTLVPPPVSDIRGLELDLAARSPKATATDSASMSTVVTSVFFKNVRAF